ncbi:hypothetical protein A3A40_02825 [Candidatus Kaiserbacteria bacterium RIFCSPLOWO2_01_FULL_54_20]|uniref:Bacteriophage T5 Orf172 DNA-binding domain-containing protein n=1 Tax=Candidatus Kaiserbacteria bacterium RIFCSPLOWO2_01_FULL_54_20 TaxID=1798513 RepID=A0A1F6EL74_9BACT|nr:MAG: hypothetical protein A3A40_02825 [Candidatus Kaiserbacteria bacterium RIFCSPLOWO2_01_FULL_54_20]
MSVSKQQILNEIKRTAKENGGKPLGASRFEKETGIKPYDIGMFWARFGDAQKEAGFMPNQLQVAHANEFVSEKIIGLTRKLGRFPTVREIILERKLDTDFPSKGTFQRLGSKGQLAKKIITYCKTKDGYENVIALCKPILERIDEGDVSTNPSNNQRLGEVYLFKHGKYYKIGKTNDTVRRGGELRIQLPENLDLIHSIKTDDPSGIEAYWHRRFESKRMNGEWFDLNSSDVKAFKSWKRIA